MIPNDKWRKVCEVAIAVVVVVPFVIAVDPRPGVVAGGMTAAAVGMLAAQGRGGE